MDAYLKTPGTFCFSPWASIDISTSGIIKPCCKFTDSTYNINDHTISEFRNSPMIGDIKHKFLKGVQPTECFRCWKEESTGIQSKRQLDYSRWHNEYSSYNLYDSKLLVLSVAVSNICNLKCRICNAKNSTKWRKEEVTYTNTEIQYQPYLKNPNVINELRSLMNNIIHIDFHGGEPLLPKNNDHIEIIQYLVNNNYANEVTLHYVTNGTIYPTPDLIELWQDFNHIDIQISLDGIKDHFEYNRFPANWDTTYINIKEFQSLADTTDNVQLNISHTLSIFTVYYLPEFINWCISEELTMPWVGRLNKPDYYQPGIVPLKSKHIVYDKLSSHHLPQVTDWQSEVFINDASEYLPIFGEWITKVDNYRNQSFTKTFPELAALL